MELDFHNLQKRSKNTRCLKNYRNDMFRFIIKKDTGIYKKL